jgi:hypothetical protein
MMKTVLLFFSLVFLSFFFTTSPAAIAEESDELWWENAEDLADLQLESINISVSKKIDDADSKGYYLNVLQDCWTTDEEEWYMDPEMELYQFPQNHPVIHVWKHKIFEYCSHYLATIVWTYCKDGKPKLSGNIFGMIRDIEVDIGEPGELILSAFVSGFPPGSYDWFIVTECDDTNGSIALPNDGDIDDILGANLGLPPNNPIGPCMMGPEPVRLLDPDPGGFPPGRWTGEEGATRCWCFEVR